MAKKKTAKKVSKKRTTKKRVVKTTKRGKRKVAKKAAKKKVAKRTAKKAPAEKTIVVTGDVTMDWNLSHFRNELIEAPSGHAENETRACWQRGGATLLADLVGAVAEDVANSEKIASRVFTVAVPPAGVKPADERFHHSYAIWSSFETSAEGRPSGWRVDRFLGFSKTKRKPENGEADWRLVRDDPARADVVILDDADLGFRDQASTWPAALRRGRSDTWFVLKMSRPVVDGKLWDRLLEKHAKKLIVLMTVGDLRRTAVRISGQISWEQTAEDLAHELRRNPAVNGVSTCAHVIVSLDTVGAMLLSRGDSAPTNELIYDPQYMEGEWTEATGEGHMIGNTGVLTAAVVRELLRNPDQPDIANGIQAGVAGMRRLHEVGYAPKGDGASRLAFPFEAVVKAMAPPEVHQKRDDEKKKSEKREGAYPLMRHSVPMPERSVSSDDPKDIGERHRWTMLADTISDHPISLATQIVKDGLEVSLPGVPRGKFKGLVTVDRVEIEALRSMRALIIDYCRRPQPRPLSVAVFGPPGAGKSFAIKQVAKSFTLQSSGNADRATKIESLTFNLSQFDGPTDLLGAFHQVRDVGLRGDIPLVFWDEFDTDLEGRTFGWLRYFLAPMQDGEFQEGQITHPIGRAIFVFAGGTKKSMREFAEVVPDQANPSKEETESEEDEAVKETDAKRQAVAAKVPDFLSRLKGYLNVLGPDPQTDGGQDYANSVIRRAILLRSLFRRIAPALFDGDTLRIDSGVLRAFLQVRKYKHGARSIESIIDMSRLADCTVFERSCLAPQPQLNLHVNGAEFMALVRQLSLEGELLEKLAEAHHRDFCENVEDTHPAQGPFEALSREDKEQNRDAVRDIPLKLARQGYVMVPSRRDEPEFKFPPRVLEEMAEDEHKRWVRLKERAGWKYGRETNPDRKTHKCIRDWNKLSKTDKDKDRNGIRNIPKLLSGEGYTIRKVEDLENEA